MYIWFERRSILKFLYSLFLCQFSRTCCPHMYVYMPIARTNEHFLQTMLIGLTRTKHIYAWLFTSHPIPFALPRSSPFCLSAYSCLLPPPSSPLPSTTKRSANTKPPGPRLPTSRLRNPFSLGSSSDERAMQTSRFPNYPSSGTPLPRSACHMSSCLSN